MFCKNCGASVAPGSRYCVSCGFDMQGAQDVNPAVQNQNDGNSPVLTNISKALNNIVKIGNANGKKSNSRVAFVMAVVITILIFLLLKNAPLFGFDKSADGRYDAEIYHTASVFYAELDDNDDEYEVCSVLSVFYGFAITSAVAVCLFKYINRSELAGVFGIIGLLTLIISRIVVGGMWKDYHSHGVTMSLAPFIFCILAFIALIIVAFVGINSEYTTEN